MTARLRSDGSHPSTLQRLSHGPLDAGERTSQCGSEQRSLVLDHDTWQSAQNHFDAALQVDATARAVHIANPDSDTFYGPGILPEFLAESSPDVCAIIGVDDDTIDANVCGCRCRRSGRIALDRPRHVVRERVAVPASTADAVPRCALLHVRECPRGFHVVLQVNCSIEG